MSLPSTLRCAIHLVLISNAHPTKGSGIGHTHPPRASAGVHGGTLGQVPPWMHPLGPLGCHPSALPSPLGSRSHLSVGLGRWEYRLGRPPSSLLKPPLPCDPCLQLVLEGAGFHPRSPSGCPCSGHLRGSQVENSSFRGRHCIL